MFSLNKNSLLKDSALVFGFRVLGMILAYISMLLITNYYGAEVFGRYSLAITLLQFLIVIFSFGLPHAIVKLTADENFFSLNKPVNEYLKKSIVLLFVTAIFSSLLLHFFSETLALRLFKDETLIKYFKGISLLLIFSIFHTFLVEFLRGKGLFKQYGLFMYVLPNVLFIGFLTYFSINEFEEVYVLFSYLFSLTILSLVLVFFLPLGNLKTSEKYSYKNLFALSFPMMFSSAFIFLSNWTDVFMLGSMVSKEDLGIYNAAYKISIIALVVINAFNTVLAPKIASLYGQNDIDQIKTEVQKATRLITYLTLPLVIVIILFRKSILNLFGDEFIDGEIVLIVFSIGLLFNAMIGSVALVLNMTSHQKELRTITLISASINFALNYILIKKYGINGAAYASIIAAIFLNVSCAILVKVKLGFLPFLSR
jgi:O-antigen/teichoic acid export membrane protein